MTDWSDIKKLHEIIHYNTIWHVGHELMMDKRGPSKGR